jgi:phosphoserine aminotransferase
MGPAGVTLLIIRKDMVGLSNRAMPTMMNYETHIKGESMYNTPPVFPIYMSYCVLKWLKKLGGVTVMEKMNQDKASLLYKELDRNSLFQGTVAVEDRSLMNVNFVMTDSALEGQFLAFAESQGISGIKGHRSVGGFRASLYNALPISSVEVLVDVLQTFEKQNG